ncbi:30S ribosomal protein S12 methylthiotransferase RimO [Christensenellaceae bacterium OttesenSCG-928-M15]|nr:30S ribosomal protein S12 methylthiotransferase RimO [Christensenellaceae bacterium OttesenSCG-928-M15]
MSRANNMIGVVSLGCSKNLMDTERMLGMLEQAGYSFTENPNEANILIINTCGFILPAKTESIDTIFEMAQYKETGVCHTLVVTGCLIERYREELKRELPEVDLFLGVKEYEKLPGLLLKKEFTPHPYARKLTTPFYSAYLRIADGCDNRCSYCAIPLIRGNLISTPMETLLDEAKRLVDGGVTEITLIAQDTSGYGRDIYGKPRLMELMEHITKLDELHWLRVLYTYPDTVTPELIAGIAGNGKICNYLDMPLQHVDDALLSAMHRRGNNAHIKRVLSYIREHAPDFMLRTTMMVGFPGETDAQFQSMLRFIEEYPFDRLGAFAFSPEDDTAAMNMDGQVEEAVKQERLEALLSLQRDLSKKRNAARVGRTVEVLVEGKADQHLITRSYAEAPEVDGKIFIADNGAHNVGEYIDARITRANDYDLEGELLF